MFDGIDKLPIDKLNFNQLRERVRILQDRYEVLIRRYPELSVIGGADAEGIDWANIVTPLINATVNKIKFTARQNYSDIVKIIDGEPDGNSDISAVYVTKNETNGKKIYWRYDTASEEWTVTSLDKAQIYRYQNKYLYWNGNEWESTEQKNIQSVFQQTPSGFSFQGVMEVKTDTNDRMTISENFIKMYPQNSDDPRLQFGYYISADGNTQYPIMIFGRGSANGEGVFETKEIMGYPVRHGQAIMIKTANSVVVGMVGDWGEVHYIELKAHTETGDDEMPGCYYFDGETKQKLATVSDITALRAEIEELKNSTSGNEGE